MKFIEEANKLNLELGAFITIAKKDFGKPIVVKDNICTKGMQTTAGSKILEGYVPPIDASVIDKLKEKGFFVLGKTALDAFGFGSFSVNCSYGVVKNPHDLKRSAGGSSGGSASFVAASKLVDYGLGQSTGGSIACPASYCGVVGLTPTYGLVSRHGLIDYASSLDRIGPITKTVRQAAELLDIISGKDVRDQTSVDKKDTYASYVGKSVSGMKIGIIKEGFGVGIDKEVSEKVKEAILKYEKLRVSVEEVSIPFLEVLVPAYYVIAMAEASTNLARYCGLRYGKSEEEKGEYRDYFSKIRGRYFGEEEKRRIILGTFVRSAGYSEKYYKKAKAIREYAIHYFKKLFEKFDALVMPTMPGIAPTFEEIKKMDVTQGYKIDLLTIPSSITGLPSLTIPVGKVKKMPVGMQFIGDTFCEGKLLQLGGTYEKIKY